MLFLNPVLTIITSPSPAGTPASHRREADAAAHVHQRGHRVHPLDDGGQGRHGEPGRQPGRQPVQPVGQPGGSLAAGELHQPERRPQRRPGRPVGGQLPGHASGEPLRRTLAHGFGQLCGENCNRQRGVQQVAAEGQSGVG